MVLHPGCKVQLSLLFRQYGLFALLELYTVGDFELDYLLQGLIFRYAGSNGSCAEVVCKLIVVVVFY